MSQDLNKEEILQENSFLTVMVDREGKGSVGIHYVKDGVPTSIVDERKYFLHQIKSEVRSYASQNNIAKIAVIPEEGAMVHSYQLQDTTDLPAGIHNEDTQQILKNHRVLSSETIVTTEVEKLAREIAKEAVLHLDHGRQYLDYMENMRPAWDKVDKMLVIKSKDDQLLQQDIPKFKGTYISDDQALHVVMANNMLPKDANFYFKPVDFVQEQVDQLKKYGIEEIRDKLLAANLNKIGENEVIRYESNHTSYTIDLADPELQFTAMNTTFNQVEYIGMKSDTTLHQGVLRAKAVEEWKIDAEALNYDAQLDSLARRGMLPDTINIPRLNTDDLTEGHLTVGEVYFRTDKELRDVFPAADKETIASHRQAINHVLDGITYDLRNHSITDERKSVYIPYETWTDRHDNGLLRATAGKVEHVGGYIASMAGVTPEDVKKLLSPKQMMQYNEAENKKLNNTLIGNPELVTNKHEYVPEKNKEVKVSRSRERGSGLGR